MLISTEMDITISLLKGLYDLADKEAPIGIMLTEPFKDTFSKAIRAIEAWEEVFGLSTDWEYGEGVKACIEIFNKHWNGYY